LHLAAAASALYRADVGECASTLRLAHAALERTPDGALSGTAGILDAALLALAGDLGDAQGVLQALPPTKFGTLAAVRTAGLAALSVSLGRPKSALQLLQEIPQRDRVAEVLVATGYAYLALGESQAAQTTARKVITEAGIAAPLPLVIEALILSGLVADRDGAESTAVEQLSRAVGLAGSEQINLPFFLASGRLGSLLSRHAALADVWPTDLREGNRSPVNVSQLGFSRNALAEGLTARESAVMRWLGTTMTTAEIAEELCVSVNTVKTHIAAIYRKLPASNRRTAVARARELQLL
jgi:LuxR family maltose regulon positive regulatory protein